VSSPTKGVYNPKAVILHAALLPQACAHWGRFLAAATRRCLGRLAVPVWLAVLSDQRPVIGLGGPYPPNDLMGRAPSSPRRKAFLHRSVCGISGGFPPLFPTRRVVRTCSSAVRHGGAEAPPSDLHALGTPPALILSQDQTRQWWLESNHLAHHYEATHHASIGQVRCHQGRQKIEGAAHHSIGAWLDGGLPPCGETTPSCDDVSVVYQARLLVSRVLAFHLGLCQSQSGTPMSSKACWSDAP
jgi:hypothetical protein